MKLLEGAVHPAYSLTCLEEERDFRERYWKVRPGDVVVDAGASYGAYTLTALQAGADFCFAFEPEPTIAVDLRRNVEANGWQDRCAVIESALWDSHAVVDMKEYAKHWPPQTITKPYPADKLDTMCGTLSRLDWFKLDVEGVEEQAIRGALETINRCKPRLIIECHTFIDAGIAERIKAMLPRYTWEEVPREPCVFLVGRVQ